MGGKIWAESRLGEGSCFHVVLPLDIPDDGQEKEEPDRPVDMCRLAGKRAMVADDNEISRQLLQEMLADWAPRREEAMREITKLLAENESEDEVRAIVSAACDADFSHEGYRAWLTWLLGRLNAL